MKQFAADLAGLLDALAIDEPVVLCGTSMGGYIALQFWQDYRTRLRGLILCDTRAAADSPETVQPGKPPTASSAKALPRWSTRCCHVCWRRPRLTTARIWSRIAQPHGLRQCAGNCRGGARHGPAPDFTPLLGQIECPTLVVVGCEDAILAGGEMPPSPAPSPAPADRDPRRRAFIADGAARRGQRGDGALPRKSAVATLWVPLLACPAVLSGVAVPHCWTSQQWHPTSTRNAPSILQRCVRRRASPPHRRDSPREKVPLPGAARPGLRQRNLQVRGELVGAIQLQRDGRQTLFGSIDRDDLDLRLLGRGFSASARRRA